MYACGESPSCSSLGTDLQRDDRCRAVDRRDRSQDLSAVQNGYQRNRSERSHKHSQELTSHGEFVLWRFLSGIFRSVERYKKIAEPFLVLEIRTMGSELERAEGQAGAQQTLISRYTPRNRRKPPLSGCVCS